MTMTNSLNTELELHESPGLNRRAVLMTAAIAATAVAGISPATAETLPAATFGAPLVELQVPAGVLTLEQKAAMIKGISDVVFNATKLTPGPTQVSFVQIFETAPGGFGVNGQVFVPRPK